MKRDLIKVLMPDHPLYTEAVEALKVYHQAEADGVVGVELERLRLMAEHFKPSLITSFEPWVGQQRRVISGAHCHGAQF